MKMTDPATFSVPLAPGRVCFNGKFLSAESTGVHRVAAELVRAVDLLLVERRAAESPIEILVPGNATRATETRRIARRVVGALTWIPWEQLELPRHARGGLLVNLCNLGPLATRRAITMVHDAQVFLSPRSYSRGFRLWYRLTLPVLGRRNQRILTVSAYSREQIARFGIAPRERITVIRNGADHILRPVADEGVLDRLGLRPRGFACALANSQAHKNIGVVLAAFARPELSDLTLVLIGGEDRAGFERRGLSVPANVVFAGRVSDGELRGLMEGALCYLCPSLTEGFGLPPLESMLLGTPAIVSPEGALPEICGGAATYAATHEPAAWASRIRRLADDPGMWRARSAVGRARAEGFTWRRAAEELLEVIAAESDRAHVR